jgi:hypothetical protein
VGLLGTLEFSFRSGGSVMQFAPPVITIGWLIALVVLILCILFFVLGMPDPKTTLFLVGALAVARLL